MSTAVPSILLAISGIIMCLQAQAADTIPPRALQPMTVEILKRGSEGAPGAVLGVGFVFEDDGFVLSAYDNVLAETGTELEHMLEVHVPSHDKRYPASIVAVEPTINLAVLKIFATAPLRAVEILPYDELAEGDAVFIANPAAGTTPSKRIEGQLLELNQRECYQESLSSTMLKLRMSLDDSSIGAPVTDAQGEVIGIYTGYRPAVDEDGYIEPVTYVLPIYLAMNIYDSIKYKQNMRSPWTGFSVRPLDASERARFPNARGDTGGIAIDHVWKKSPADRMGIREGEVLVRLGHYRIESVADFQKWLYMYGVGLNAKLGLIAPDDTYRELDYLIEERPAWAVPR